MRDLQPESPRSARADTGSRRKVSLRDMSALVLQQQSRLPPDSRFGFPNNPAARARGLLTEYRHYRGGLCPFTVIHVPNRARERTFHEGKTLDFESSAFANSATPSWES